MTFSEAALGAGVKVPTMNGPVTLKVPAGTAIGEDVPHPGKGRTEVRGGHGDLLVTVKVDVPSKLSKKEKELLESLRDEAEPVSPGASRHGVVTSERAQRRIERAASGAGAPEAATAPCT